MQCPRILLFYCTLLVCLSLAVPHRFQRDFLSRRECYPTFTRDDPESHTQFQARPILHRILNRNLEMSQLRQLNRSVARLLVPLRLYSAPKKRAKNNLFDFTKKRLVHLLTRTCTNPKYRQVKESLRTSTPEDDPGVLACVQRPEGRLPESSHF